MCPSYMSLYNTVLNSGVLCSLALIHHYGRNSINNSLSVLKMFNLTITFFKTKNYLTRPVKIVLFCKRYNKHEIWIIQYVKYGIILTSNKKLARGLRDFRTPQYISSFYKRTITVSKILSCYRWHLIYNFVYVDPNNYWGATVTHTHTRRKYTTTQLLIPYCYSRRVPYHVPYFSQTQWVHKIK